MEIEFLYHRGTAKAREDRLIDFPKQKIFGVIDGVSGLYHPNEGPLLFDGRTGGQMAGDTINEILSAERRETLFTQLAFANGVISDNQIKTPLDRSDLLAGAVVALIKVKATRIEVVQCGDCFALWRYKNGEIGITKNQTFQHDREMLDFIANFMKKHKGTWSLEETRKRMWREFGPILAEKRLERVNKDIEAGYGVLNGQPEAMNYLYTVTLNPQDLHLIILFTDGFVYYPETGEEKKLGQTILELYYKNGLAGILERTRRLETQTQSESHISHAEATAIAIEF